MSCNKYGYVWHPSADGEQDYFSFSDNTVKWLCTGDVKKGGHIKTTTGSAEAEVLSGVRFVHGLIEQMISTWTSSPLESFFGSQGDLCIFLWLREFRIKVYTEKWVCTRLGKLVDFKRWSPMGEQG